MNNPFETLNSRLSTLETLALKILDRLDVAAAAPPEVGSIQLAMEVTRLSKARIYTLVSERNIPHSKRGNKLYFNRQELLQWVAVGKRATA